MKHSPIKTRNAAAGKRCAQAKSVAVNDEI